MFMYGFYRNLLFLALIAAAPAVYGKVATKSEDPSSVVSLGGGVSTAATVSDITGDSGSGQTGSVVLSGGSTGATFDSTTSTITLSFSDVKLPLASSSAGRILAADAPILHNYYSGANIFVGAYAGNFGLTGSNNTACGGSALNSLTNGAGNTAVGQSSLVNLTTGVGNIAIGTSVATALTDGNNNILIGASAGALYSSGESNNIIIGQGNSGRSGDFNTIRIGLGNSFSACYIDGIYNATPDATSALPAYVDVFGNLGTSVSVPNANSVIFPINDSSRILKLKPIAFVAKDDPNKLQQYGLQPEDVAQILPELVVRDEKGAPFAVKYHELPVLLISELQRKQAEVDELREHVRTLENRLRRVERIQESRGNH